MYLYTTSVFGCGQIHVAVSNSEHQAWVFQPPRVRVGSFPLKSNKQSLCSRPRSHGVNSIPRTEGTYTVTCPEVAHFEDSLTFTDVFLSWSWTSCFFGPLILGPFFEALQKQLFILFPVRVLHTHNTAFLSPGSTALLCKGCWILDDNL